MKLILFIVLFFSFSGNASPRRFINSNNGVTAIFLTFTENDQWVVQKFVVPNQGLQELEWSHRFSTEWESLEFLKSVNKEIKLQELSSDNKNLNAFANTEVKNKSLWEVKNDWSEDWEQKFHDWVEANFDTSFFSRYSIATDCADAAIMLRWIFSREHALPIGNTLAGTGVLFTQESMKKKWLELPTSPIWHEDKRFLAVLNYLADMTYTHSLFVDSYPIAVSHSTFRPGNFLLSKWSESGHTQIIGETNFNTHSTRPVVLYASTVPKAVRELSSYVYLDSERETPESGGFRQIRWLVKENNKNWTLLSESEHPDYSLDQYSKKFEPDKEGFAIKLYRFLIPGFDPSKTLKSSIEDLKTMIISRVDIVENGYQMCQTIDCAPGTQGWEDWSTPSRDKRIRNKFMQIESLISTLKDVIDPSVWHEALKENVVSVNNKLLKLGEVREIWMRRIYSPDPRDFIDLRWALDQKSVNLIAEKKIRSNFNIRSSLVKDAEAKCIKNRNCSPKSENFKILQTFSLDEEIRDIFAGYISYCHWRESGCPNFEKNQFLELWSKKIPFFVSDPNVNADTRWGIQGESFDSLQYISNQRGRFEIIDNWIIGGDGKSFKNLDTNNEVNLPLQSTCQRIDKGSRFFCVNYQFAENSNDKFLYTFSDKGDFIALKIGDNTSNVASIVLVSDLTVGVQISDRLLVYSFNKHELVLVQNIAGTIVSPSEEIGSSILMKNNNGSYLVSIVQKKAIMEPITLPSHNSLSMGKLGKDWLYFKLSISDSHSQTHFYSLKDSIWSKQIIENDELISYDTVNGIYLFGDHSSGKYDLFLGSPLSWLKVNTFFKFYQMMTYFNEHYFFSFDNQTDFLKFDGKQFLRFPPKRTEKLLFAFNKWAFLQDTENLSYFFTDFSRKQKFIPNEGEMWVVCGFISSFCFEPQDKQGHFVLVTPQQNSQISWTTLYKLNSIDLKLHPIASRELNTSNETQNSFGPSFSANEGRVIKWNEFEYIYVPLK